MDGIGLIAEERTRQIIKEGYNATHDDKHINGELAVAAACYAVYGLEQGDEYYEVGRIFCRGIREGEYEEAFPWGADSDRREDHSPLRRLVIAGALIAAEIDRLHRAGSV